jgi:hypothetical protein
MKKLLTLLSLAALAVGFCYAADTTSETLTVQKVTRISSVNISAEYGKDPSISIYREQVRAVGNDVISREGLPSSTRTLTQAGATKVTLPSGKTLTGAEFMEAVIAFGRVFKTEDEEAAAALAAAKK